MIDLESYAIINNDFKHESIVGGVDFVKKFNFSTLNKKLKNKKTKKNDLNLLIFLNILIKCIIVSNIY